MSKVQQTFQRSRSLRWYVCHVQTQTGTSRTAGFATFYGKHDGRPLSTINIPLNIHLGDADEN